MTMKKIYFKKYTTLILFAIIISVEQLSQEVSGENTTKQKKKTQHKSLAEITGILIIYYHQ